MKRSFYVLFALAGLPLSAAVLRHGAPQPVMPSVQWKDDSKVALEWPAPADPKAEFGTDDEGNYLVTGPVSSYTIRVTSVLPPVPGPYDMDWYWQGSEAGYMWDWAEAAPEFPNAMTPADPGQIEHITITGLAPSTHYYIFVMDYDDMGQSTFSPLIEVTTDAVDSVPPATHALTVTPDSATALLVKWTMPGDDGDGGNPAGAFELRMATSPDDWSTAGILSSAGPGDLPPPGLLMAVAAQSLSPGTTYYFRLIVSDPSGNASGAWLGSGSTTSFGAGDDDGDGEGGSRSCSAAAAGSFAALLLPAIALLRRRPAR